MPIHPTLQTKVKAVEIPKDALAALVAHNRKLWFVFEGRDQRVMNSCSLQLQPTTTHPCPKNACEKLQARGGSDDANDGTCIEIAEIALKEKLIPWFICIRFASFCQIREFVRM